MSAALACGRWCAVVRLGLAPRRHRVARPLLQTRYVSTAKALTL